MQVRLNIGFFPKHWTPEQLVEKIEDILDVVDNPIRSKQHPGIRINFINGTKIIDFPENPEVFIRIIIQNENQIKTYFPSF